MASKQSKGQKYGRGKRSPSNKAYNSDMRAAKNKRLRIARHKKAVEKKAAAPIVKGTARKARRAFLQVQWEQRVGVGGEVHAALTSGTAAPAFA